MAVTMAGAVLGDVPEDAGSGAFSRQSGALVDRREQEGGGMPVDLLIDGEDRQALSRLAVVRKRAVSVPVAAVDVDALGRGVRVHVSLRVDESPAPRTTLDLQHSQSIGPRRVVRSNSFHLLACLGEALGAHARTDPQADSERPFAPRCGVFLPD